MPRLELLLEFQTWIGCGGCAASARVTVLSRGCHKVAMKPSSKTDGGRGKSVKKVLVASAYGRTVCTPRIASLNAFNAARRLRIVGEETTDVGDLRLHAVSGRGI